MKSYEVDVVGVHAREEQPEEEAEFTLIRRLSRESAELIIRSIRLQREASGASVAHEPTPPKESFFRKLLRRLR